MRTFLEIYFGINLFLAGIQFDNIDVDVSRFKRIGEFILLLLFGVLFIIVIDLMVRPVKYLISYLQLKFFWKFIIQRQFRNLTNEELERVNVASNRRGNSIRDRIYKYCTKLVNKKNSQVSEAMKKHKKEVYRHGIVPKDSTYKNSKIYNELKNIPGTTIDMVKGIIFLDGDREAIQKYLDENRNLFEYTK